ncbi:STAS domain-containing protein [Caldimonas brevitalea]|uniref:STAS domain-containing protein n=1 Tax=Caldimonas brevitalea TaxID=413882 RepID=A0A0G3BGJ6_9BURK|nr:hypothetical protein AAW51_0412 [Caldimonas brevitalea]
MLTLTGEMTIYRAHEIKVLLLQAVADGQTELDLSGVAELDTAGLQLLILAKREAAARGGALRFIQHSPAVLDVLNLLDPAGHFGDPLLLPGTAA